MVTDQQVRRLFKLMSSKQTLATAASKAGMDEKTARKYRRSGKLPSEVKKPHDWRTRSDAFNDVWEELRGFLDTNPGLEAKTLFVYLQRQYPGRFADGQLRTLQRRVKRWRSLEGPPKEVFFAQEYHAGERSQSDFTWMNKLGVRIAGERFDHMLFHFVLPYSNWETGTICFSESFESLADGLQNAFFELGGVPQFHHTDSMSAAVRRLTGGKKAFTEKYTSLLRHYGLKAMRSNPASPNELGDAEQRHHRFKRALDQALMMRGSREFADRASYAAYLDRLFMDLNRGRRERFSEELAQLRKLPLSRYDGSSKLTIGVSRGSLIRVRENVYSVNSRLIGETVEVRIHANHLEVWYAQKLVERLPRLRGQGKSCVNYRHVIDSLVRKPGAFANYRYRSDLFPSHRFRVAYDMLSKRSASQRAADKAYLKILYLAARESEQGVDNALGQLIEEGTLPTKEVVEVLLASGNVLPSVREVDVAPVALEAYDELLTAGGDGSTLEVAPW